MNLTPDFSRAWVALVVLDIERITPCSSLCPGAATNFPGISMGWRPSKGPRKLPSCLRQLPASFIRWSCLASERPPAVIFAGPQDPGKVDTGFPNGSCSNTELKLDPERWDLFSGEIMLGSTELQGTP